MFPFDPPCMRRRVIVNLKDRQDEAYRGILWMTRGAWLVLRDTTLIQPHVPPATIDGEVVIHRSNVSFVQVEP